MSASSRMPWALRLAALSSRPASRAFTKGSEAPLPVRSKARGTRPRLASMTVTIFGEVGLTASSFLRSARALFSETSEVLRPAERQRARAADRSSRRPVHSGPNVSASHSRRRRARPGTVPPVEAVINNSPRRTIAGTWKSHNGSTSSTLTRTPRARARPARCRASPSASPATNSSCRGARIASETSGDSSRASTPASARRAARRARASPCPTRPAFMVWGIKNDRQHSSLWSSDGQGKRGSVSRPAARPQSGPERYAPKG